jgi:hypothetical protein
MTIATGSPLGNILSQEEIYVEGSPYVYIQDYRAGPLRHPDANGYYYGMSGSSAYPVYNLGCIQNTKMTEDVTLNQIRCDTEGDKAVVQKRNYLQFEFDLISQLPLSVTKVLMNMFNSTTVSGAEYVGIGKINNAVFYMLYAPKVYDDSVSDWLLIHLHKCQITGNFTWDFGVSGWKLTGIQIRAFADSTKPEAALFGTIVRFDPSALP